MQDSFRSYGNCNYKNLVLLSYHRSQDSWILRSIGPAGVHFMLCEGVFFKVQ